MIRMQFSAIALSALFVGFAAAQGLGFNNLPECARGCATNSLPTQCQLNINCICEDASFITSISCCVSKACSPQDQQNTLNTARDICSGANVVLPSAASCANGTSTTATAPTSTGAANRLATQAMGVAGAVLGAAVLF